MRTISVFPHVEVLLTAFAVGSISVGLTIHAVASVAGQVVKVAIKVAFVRVAVAVTWFALMGVLGSGSSPWSIVVERQTLLAIGAIGVMFALANLSSFTIQPCAIDALVGVSVTFATGTNCNISDCIEVRPEYLLVTEQLVTESVESVQDDSNVSGSDKLLEFIAVFEVVGAGPTLERREGNITELEW